MLGRSGSWVGTSVAGAIASGRWWFYQDFSAGSAGPLTLTDNENGTGIVFSSANLVANSSVITDTGGQPVYTSATSTSANRVTVSSQVGAVVTMSGTPHSSFGSVRVWYLYTASTGSLPLNMTVAPQLVQAARAEWLDVNYLNQNMNLSDLTNAATARTNLGFSNITTGQIEYGNGGTTPASDAFLFWDSSNKFLGIGTSAPTTAMQIATASAAAIVAKFTNSVTGALVTDGFNVGIDSSGNAVLTQIENLPLIISTNNTEVARFNATGELLLKVGLQLEDTDAGTNKVTLQASSSLAVDWALTLPTTAGTSGYALTTDGAGVTTWTSPTALVGLTTKGDILTYGTAIARLGVGTYGQALIVDSAATNGIKWGSSCRAGTTAIASGATTKAIVFTNVMPSATYSVIAVLSNYTDSPVQRQVCSPIVRTASGFTVEWENATDSANTVLEWQCMETIA